MVVYFFAECACKPVSQVRMPNWNKHYVVDIVVLLALMFLTTIYSHPLLQICHPERKSKDPLERDLMKNRQYIATNYRCSQCVRSR